MFWCSKGYEGNTAKSPKHAICNGLVMAKVPELITELNEVELALISTARVNEHMFSVTAGTHESIKGWRSMRATILNISMAQQIALLQTRATEILILKKTAMTEQKILKMRF
jgi:hypothetical protein